MAAPPLQEVITSKRLEGTFPFIQSSHTPLAQPVKPHVVRPQPFAVTGKASCPFPYALFADLTKREVQLVLEVLHHAVQARTGDQVQHVLLLMQKAVMATRTIGGVVQLTPKGAFKGFNSVLNVSYSNEWLYTYGTKEYAKVDPVLQTLLKTRRTQVWKQTYRTISSPKHAEFIEEAGSYGLTHGITTGLVDSTQPYATFVSFAGGDVAEMERYKGLAEYLQPFLHPVLMANIDTPLPNRFAGLSGRETSVLRWMREGKTNWEIAKILQVSERTVRFHVEGVFRKLDVCSRTQAVALAVEHGLAEPDPADEHTPSQ